MNAEESHLAEIKRVEMERSKMKQINFKALAHLKAHREQLTKQQFATLRGQIFSGNADGAMKGLRKLLKPN